MSHLVARTGRHQQRYDGGCRLVAGFGGPEVLLWPDHLITFFHAKLSSKLCAVTTRMDYGSE